MENGWRKLYRELLGKTIWIESTPGQKVLLATLLMMANHGENSSVQKIRTALKKFARYEFPTDESTLRNHLITIVN